MFRQSDARENLKGGKMFSTNPSDVEIHRLGNYTISSGDLYYSECGQREIFISDDPGNGFQIWGEVPGFGSVSSINLCEIFLEYSMFCQSSREREQAYAEMKTFGENLGHMLAQHLKKKTGITSSRDPGACALECIFESVHANINIERIGPDLRFIIANCPLIDASEKTGLNDADFAQFGFNIMVQRVLSELDPHMLLNMPRMGDKEHAYTIHKPILPRFEPLAMTILPNNDLRKEMFNIANN